MDSCDIFQKYTQDRIETAQKNIATLHLAENDVAIVIYADSLMETSHYDYYVIQNYSTEPSVLSYNQFDDISIMDAIIRQSLCPNYFLFGGTLGEIQEEKIFDGTSPIKRVCDNKSLENIMNLVSVPSAISCILTRFSVPCEGYGSKEIFDKIYSVHPDTYKGVHLFTENKEIELGIGDDDNVIEAGI